MNGIFWVRIPTQTYFLYVSTNLYCISDRGVLLSLKDNSSHMSLNSEIANSYTNLRGNTCNTTEGNTGSGNQGRLTRGPTAKWGAASTWQE